MKRYKRLGILLGILAVACIATFALTRYEQEQERIQTSDAVILEIPSDSVQALSWDYEDGLAFHKGDDGWRYDEDEAFPVSQEKIQDILSHFESFGVAFIIEDVTDYSQYGLDDPQCTIHLETADQSFDIKLGDFSRMDEQRYIDIGDGNVYLAREDPMDYVESALSSMIQHDDTPGFEKVVDIQFAGSETGTIRRNDDSTDTYNPEDIYFVNQDGESVPLDTSKVRKYLNTITSLNLLNYVTYNATEEELAACGLDDPELSVTVHYTYTDEDGEEVSDTCVIHISRNPEELQAAEEAEAAGETAGAVSKYVRVGDSQIIYQLDDVDYGILSAASYDDLRHEEVFWADFDLVTGIDVTLEGQTHSIRSAVDEKDESRDWFYGEEELEIDDLRDALEDLTADHFTDEVPGEKEEISLTVYLDNENFPQVTIQLYRYDGSFCMAVVDGEPVSLVNRSDVMDLVEAVQAIVLN